MESVLDIHDMEVARLQALVTKYPWFSYAREVLLCKLVEIEPQCLESRYKDSQVFFPKREKVFFKCKALALSASRSEEELAVSDLLDVEVEPLEELSLDISFEDMQSDKAADDGFDLMLDEGSETIALEMAPVKERFVVVGGDYFSKDDLAQLDESERVAEIKLGAPADNMDRDAYLEPSSNNGVYDSLDFVTETLAKIYADQGYYDKAIEVYAKLILLYPEKSTYFATLVNEIKSKN